MICLSEQNYKVVKANTKYSRVESCRPVTPGKGVGVGGWVLQYVSYIGMCRPIKGYGLGLGFGGVLV